MTPLVDKVITVGDLVRFKKANYKFLNYGIQINCILKVKGISINGRVGVENDMGYVIYLDPELFEVVNNE